MQELAPILVKHPWTAGKKFLLVPFHLIGARNLETAILGGYVEHVRRHHPDAPLPGVFVADDPGATSARPASTAPSSRSNSSRTSGRRS
jgi:hypothetical protein